MKIDRAEAIKRAQSLIAIGWNANEVRLAGMILAAVKETAEECAKVGYLACHLPVLPDNDPGGCEGCETGWCQSAVDAACESRNQFHDAIRTAFELDPEPRP